VSQRVSLPEVTTPSVPKATESVVISVSVELPDRVDVGESVDVTW
jgi:hypothetical protein